MWQTDRRWFLSFFLLFGCEQVPTPDERMVKIVLVEDVKELKRECGPSVLEPYGCAKLHGKNCTIVAMRPSGFDDSPAIKTLGHELWHCFIGDKHL